MFLVIYDGWTGDYGCKMYVAGLFGDLFDAERCRNNVIETLKALSPKVYEYYDEYDWDSTVKIIEITPDTEYYIKKGYHCLETKLNIGGYIE